MVVKVSKVVKFRIWHLGELDFSEISIDRKYLDKVEDVFSFAFDAVNNRYQFVRDITKEEA